MRPSSAAEVLEIVRRANASGRTLEVRAGGTKASLGNPVRADDVMDTSDLRGIVDYDPAELVLTARPATPLSEIVATLAATRQHLAWEPPDYSRLLASGGTPTLGGVLATNLSGPRRIAAGGARDHFLGLEAVSGRAETFRSGGRVVKNVTGYDLSKLLAGSFGTLAVMTEVTVKVLPAPEDVCTVLVRGLAAENAVNLMCAVTALPLDVTGLAHVPASLAANSGVSVVRGAGSSVTALRLEGIPASVSSRLARLRDAVAEHGVRREENVVLNADDSRAFWAEVRDALLLPPGIVWKISVPPQDGARVGAEIARQAHCDVLHDWAGGLLWVVLHGQGAEAPVVRGAIARCGGHATLVRAPAAERERTPAFQPLAPALAALSLRVKQSFDPMGLLNPGRMASA